MAWVGGYCEAGIVGWLGWCGVVEMRVVWLRCGWDWGGPKERGGWWGRTVRVYVRKM